MGRLRSGRDAFDGLAEVVDRRGFVAGAVLDRAADETDRRRLPDRLRRILRAVAEPVLEIGRDRQVDAVDDQLGVPERLVRG